MAIQSFLLKRVEEQSRHVWNDPVCGMMLRWLGGGIVGAVGITVGFYRRLPAEIPLWFSRPWGQAQLANKEWIIVLPGSLIGITLITLLVAGMVYREEKLLARMVIGGMGLVGFLLIYALIKIISLAI